MPRKQTLKVYRTPIGFHDAYVAAASQKAALEAWGSDANLFARGMAEIVTDGDLTREPLANPGKVIRRLRGTVEEQIAALPKSAPIDSRGLTSRSRRSGLSPEATKPKLKPAPRPDRSPVDDATKAIDEADMRFEEALQRLKDRQSELDRERRSLEQAHEREVAELQSGLDRAKAAYARAMAKWKSS